MLSHLTFAPPTDDDLRDGTLGRQLRQYNYRFVGEYPAQQPVRLDARDAQGDWWAASVVSCSYIG